MRLNMSKKLEKKLDQLADTVNQLVEATVKQSEEDSELEKVKRELTVAREDPAVQAYSAAMRDEAMSGVHNGFRRRNRGNQRYGNYNAILRDYVRAKEALEDISAS